MGGGVTRRRDGLFANGHLRQKYEYKNIPGIRKRKKTERRRQQRTMFAHTHTHRSNCPGVSGSVSEGGLPTDTKSNSSTPGTRSARPNLKNPSVMPLLCCFGTTISTNERRGKKRGEERRNSEYQRGRGGETTVCQSRYLARAVIAFRALLLVWRVVFLDVC